VSSVKNQRITLQSLLFLFGLLVLSSYFIVPGYYYFGPPQKVPEHYSFTLSEESPSYVYNVPGAEFGISSLKTNDTLVGIVIWHQDQVIFNATDIQEISDYDIEIPASRPYDWQVEVVRQNADALVNLTTYQWANAVAYEMPAPFLFYFVTGLVIACYALYSMFNSSRRPTSDEYRGAKFLALVVSLLIGTLFCYPLANGLLRDDFTPITSYASLPDETYQFTLNGTHPTSSLNLSLLYPEGESSVSMMITSIASSEYPLQLSVTTDTTYNLTLEEESDGNDWSIIIPIAVNSTSLFSINRIDTDSAVEFKVEVEYQTRTPREDILIPGIFGIIGFSAIVIGLFLAFELEREFPNSSVDNAGIGPQ
jgi:hypothetical protein